MLNRRDRRSGFTLPEVLVTVAIVAVLAAIVVPAVTSQISKGDDSKFQTSLGSVRTGITAFISDTRKFPGRVSDLYNPIAGTDNDLFAADYLTASTRWKGPYVSGALAAGATLDLSHAQLADALVDSNLFSGTSGHVIGTFTAASVSTQAQANYLDALIDSGNGNAAGIIQWDDVTDPITVAGEVKIQLMGSR